MSRPKASPCGAHGCTEHEREEADLLGPQLLQVGAAAQKGREGLVALQPGEVAVHQRRDGLVTLRTRTAVRLHDVHLWLLRRMAKEVHLSRSSQPVVKGHGMHRRYSIRTLSFSWLCR